MTALLEIFRLAWAVQGFTHWIAWLGFIYTCYYFRYFSGKIQGDPSECAVSEEKTNYSQENALRQWHGLFVWLVALVTILYVSKLAFAIAGYPVYHPDKAVSKIFFGSLHVLATVLLLFSCHYVRFLAGSGIKCFSCMAFGQQRKKVFAFQSFLNSYHGHFFWIALATGVLLHFI